MSTGRKLYLQRWRLDYFRDGAVLQDEKTQDVRVGWGTMIEGLEHGGMMVFKSPVINLICSHMRSSPLCQYKIKSM